MHPLSGLLKLYLQIKGWEIKELGGHNASDQESRQFGSFTASSLLLDGTVWLIDPLIPLTVSNVPCYY